MDQNQKKRGKRFRVETLGCRTNQYESQAYHDQLVAMGYTPAEEGEEADLCIVNTCTVTESADSSSRSQIRQLARNNPDAKIIVTGCMVESKPAALKEMAEISLIVPNLEKENLVRTLFPEEESLPEFSIRRFDAHTRAFVKVQDGCNSFCTYCVIPYVRGRSRSRGIPEIVDEVKGLIANGFREVVLTGINIGDFDGGKGKGEAPDRLCDLIKAVDRIEGLERLRVSSIDPDEVDDELIDVIVNGRRTCHSMHVVLQSGSNVILKRMNRKYTRQIFLETAERLKAACPDFTFTTDVIVGFPGETERDFEETLEVMEEIEFAKVHMFPYSSRPRTKAATYPNQIAEAVKKERKRRVMHCAEQIAFRLRQRYVGRKMKVLTEGGERGRPGEISGHTDNFLLVHVLDGDLSSNQIVEVVLIENTPEGLVGKLCYNS